MLASIKFLGCGLGEFGYGKNLQDLRNLLEKMKGIRIS